MRFNNDPHTKFLTVSAEKHGRAPRQWRKLHLAIDAQTGEIVAHVLTDKDVSDIGTVPALLATVEGPIASVIATAPTTMRPSTRRLLSASKIRCLPSSSRRARLR